MAFSVSRRKPASTLARPPGQRARPAAENAALTQPQTDKIPSSAAFDAIAAALSDDADRKDAVKKGGAVFAFTIKNQGGETESWYIDLKKTGTVGKGAAPEGGKSDGEFRNVRVVWMRASTCIHRHASISRSPRALGIMVSASASAPPACGPPPKPRQKPNTWMVWRREWR